MHECLSSIGIQSNIARQPDSTADINHYMLYDRFDGKKHSTDTIMITHIDNLCKLDLMKKLLINAEMGICMSRDTMDNLANLGVPRNKLCYINPAHDGVIIPKPKVVGLASRVYIDGRKREHFLSRLAKDIDPRLFSFKIMGNGWDDRVNDLRDQGFSVEYTNDFDYDKYLEVITSLDYYLYMGHDEGQMGFVDALAAGVETIVTPQGYHLDAEGGISYAFNTYNELLAIFKTLTNKRLKLINSVSNWKWEDYTLKHLEIWEYLLARNNDIISPPDRNYCDGLCSVEQFDKRRARASSNNRLILGLLYNKYKHDYRQKRYDISDIIKKGGYLVFTKKLFRYFLRTVHNVLDKSIRVFKG